MPHLIIISKAEDCKNTTIEHEVFRVGNLHEDIIQEMGSASLPELDSLLWGNRVNYWPRFTDLREAYKYVNGRYTTLDVPYNIFSDTL